MSELEKICNHVAFIQNGSLIESGALLDVVKKFGQNKYLLKVSDVERLHLLLVKVKGVFEVNTSGISTISLKIEKGSLSSVRREIERLAVLSDVKIYSFESAFSLEEAFKELSENEFTK